MERQGFGIRLVALLIDVVILILAGTLISLIFGRGLNFSFRLGAPQGSLAYNLVSILVNVAYFSTEIFNAASPGKMLLGLKIGSETGAPATQNQLVTRWAIKNSGSLLAVPSLIPLLGILFAVLSLVAWLVVIVGCFLALGQKRLALHDILAHTAVYKLATAPPPPPVV